MSYLGDFKANSTVRFKLTTSDTTGAAVEPSSPFDISDFLIYKDDSAVQRASFSGITVTGTFDGVTGLTHVTIDLSDNGDSGFYAASHDYFVVLAPGYGGTGTGTETVATYEVVRVVAEFSIQNRWVDVQAIDGNTTAATNQSRAARAIARGVVTSGSTTTVIATSSLSPSPTDNDQLKGRIVIFDSDTTTTGLRDQASDVTANDTSGNITVTALTRAPASGDSFGVY